jgi:hypothetical protein
MSSQSARVLSGPYAGFTRAEMQTEFARYKAQLIGSGSNLQAVSINGQSLSFGPRRDWSLTEWGRQVQAALAQVDPTYCPPQSTIRAHWGRDC